MNANDRVREDGSAGAGDPQCVSSNSESARGKRPGDLDMPVERGIAGALDEARNECGFAGRGLVALTRLMSLALVDWDWEGTKRTSLDDLKPKGVDLIELVQTMESRFTEAQRQLDVAVGTARFWLQARAADGENVREALVTPDAAAGAALRGIASMRDPRIGELDLLAAVAGEGHPHHADLCKQYALLQVNEGFMRRVAAKLEAEGNAALTRLMLAGNEVGA